MKNVPEIQKFSQKYFLSPKTGIKKAGISAGKNGSNIHIAKKRQHKEILCTAAKSLICESQIFFEILIQRFHSFGNGTVCFIAEPLRDFFLAKSFFVKIQDFPVGFA